MITQNERKYMTQTVPVNEEPKVEPEGQKPEKDYREEIQVRGEQLVAKVKELLHEGNVVTFISNRMIISSWSFH